MKKLLVVIMALCLLCACFAGCTPTQNPTEEPTQAATEQATEQATQQATEQPTATPTATPEPPKSVMDSSKFTYFVLSDYTQHVPEFDIGKGDGWPFNPNGGGYEEIRYEDGKIIIVENEGLITYRFDFGENRDNAANAPLKDYDAIAFYVENNSVDDAGISYFGEVYSATTNLACQLTYNGTTFDQTVCYLMDLEGNVTACEECLDDAGHGLALLPAGFKGYYICTLDTLGHDYCYYKSYGYHGGVECGNGAFLDDTYMSSGGINLFTVYDEDANYVVYDYKLVKFNQG